MGSKSAGAASSSSTSSATVQHEAGGAHVLLLPYPGAQGHTNPLLQFGRRLAYLGLRPTLVCSRYVLSTTPPPGEPFRVAAISDGFDDGGAASCPDLSEYWRQLQAVGSETLAELLRSEASEGRPVRVLVYDPHLAWARRVAKAAGVAAAAFLSQPCSVDIVYGEVWAGRLELPVTDGRELFARGLLGVEFGPDDVPPFAARPDCFPVFIEASVRQFEGLEEADDVLVNSFHAIEPKVRPATCLLYCSCEFRVLFAPALLFCRYKHQDASAITFIYSIIYDYSSMRGDSFSSLHCHKIVLIICVVNGAGGRLYGTDMACKDNRPILAIILS